MNVIVIVADSFRKDHLGGYGNDWISTPNLDAFAARACVIDGAYADSLNTAACRTSMMLGRVNFPHRPWRAGLPPRDRVVGEAQRRGEPLPLGGTLRPARALGPAA